MSAYCSYDLTPVATILSKLETAAHLFAIMQNWLGTVQTRPRQTSQDRLFMVKTAWLGLDVDMQMCKTTQCSPML